jgi:ferric-dicitrate binding protein FerR (iron transport regulator)
MYMGIHWDILARAIHDQVTPAEKKMLDEWLAASADHQCLWDQLKERQRFLDTLVTEDEQTRQWLALQTRLGMRPEDSLAGLQTQGEQTRDKFSTEPHLRTAALPGETRKPARIIPLRRWMKLIAASAAVLLLLVLSKAFHWLGADEDGDRRNMITIAATDKAPRKILLPDGSTIWLQYRSQVSWDTLAFGKEKRKINLNGAAFFDVAKKAHSPFMIETEKMHVDVLGTSFSVYARTGEPQEIKVATGSVRVMAGERKEQLMAGNALSYDEHTRTWTRKTVGVEEASGLLEKRLYFENDNLMAIAAKLEAWYGKHVVVQEEGPDTGAFSFTGIVHDDGITNVLNGLSYLAGFTYMINDSEIIIYPQP